MRVVCHQKPSPTPSPFFFIVDLALLQRVLKSSNQNPSVSMVRYVATDYDHVPRLEPGHYFFSVLPFRIDHTESSHSSESKECINTPPKNRMHKSQYNMVSILPAFRAFVKFFLLFAQEFIFFFIEKTSEAVDFPRESIRQKWKQRKLYEKPARPG